MEGQKMKKIYQTPEINKVLYGSSIMETELTPASVGLIGHGDDENTSDLTPGFGGDGGSGQGVDAKGTGRFWDDEY